MGTPSLCLHAMKIIDTHCHLDFSDFDADRQAVIRRARALSVDGFIIPGVVRSRWDNLIRLCQAHAGFYYALGLHPMFMEHHRPHHMDDLQVYVEAHQPVAIGETGLDFYHAGPSQKQIQVFEAQLALACDADLPVILHVRKAHQDVLRCLKKYPVKGGVVHAFNGSLQQAEHYQRHNFKFGIGGMLTYARSGKLRRLARALPLESIMLETDSPDMTVEQHRGERNSPEYLGYCLHALAEVKNLTKEEVASATSANARDLFNLNRFS